MNKSAKVLVTIGAIFIYFIIAIIVVAGLKEAGQSAGFISLIMLAALIGALKAIWSKPKQDDGKDNDDEKSILQK